MGVFFAMIFSIFLTLIFSFLCLCALILTKRILRYLTFSILGFGVFFIWFPDLSTSLANFFGIGRGIDFVLTLLSITLMVGLFFCLVYMNVLQRKLTLIARHIAIREAMHYGTAKSYDQEI